MTISSRTPEGQPFRCPVCREDTDLEPSPAGDACCPSCGELLWWFRDRVDARLSLESSYADLHLDSIEFVELVMQLEAEHSINLSEAAAEEIETIEDLIRALRRKRKEQRGE
jgi:acyl carrier protein